jgi:hypothetical protein
MRGGVYFCKACRNYVGTPDDVHNDVRSAKTTKYLISCPCGKSYAIITSTLAERFNGKIYWMQLEPNIYFEPNKALKEFTGIILKPCSEDESSYIIDYTEPDLRSLLLFLKL